jgi:hypothetical protein
MLKKLLHPEVLMGLRGPKEEFETYEVILNGISFEGPNFKIANSVCSLFEGNEIHSYITMKQFVDSKGKVYHFNNSLCESLSKIDRDLPIDFLPKKFSGYISLGNDCFQSPQGYSVDGAYVNIYESTTMGLALRIACCEIKNGIPYLYNTLSFTLKNLKLDLIMQNLPCSDFPVDREARKAANQINLAVINAVLYLHSADLLTNEGVTMQNKKPLLGNKKALKEPMQCKVPVIFVNRDYHARHYSVDGTWVSEHMRWQRCGAGLSQIKLVWIKGHERRYDKNLASAV